VVTFLLFTVLVGWVAKGLIGRSLILWAESLVLSIPVVRSLYSGLKQIVETVLSQGEQNFEKACLVEYPRKGIWAICLHLLLRQGRDRGQARAERWSRSSCRRRPTRPRAFCCSCRVKDVIVLDMTVEDAAKLIISAGLVYPNGEEAKKALEDKVPEAAE
jgi:uncharacterized membrane protein